jgi:hypothetical protein
MVVHRILCGKTDPIRYGRNGRPGMLGSYEKMKAEIQNSFLKTCPELCQSCLCELYEFVFSPEKKRLFNRRREVNISR